MQAFSPHQAISCGWKAKCHDSCFACVNAVTGRIHCKNDKHGLFANARRSQSFNPLIQPCDFLISQIVKESIWHSLALFIHDWCASKAVLQLVTYLKPRLFIVLRSEGDTDHVLSWAYRQRVCSTEGVKISVLTCLRGPVPRDRRIGIVLVSTVVLQSTNGKQRNEC